MNENQLLKKEIADLKRDVDLLKKATVTNLPYSTDRTIEARQFLKYISVEQIDPLEYDTLNTEVPTTPDSFPVIGFPVRWLKINLTFGTNNQFFYIPIYTLSDLPL
jgi:hypothetical protein